MSSLLYNQLKTTAARYLQKQAFIEPEKELTYQQVQQSIDDWAEQFIAAGVQPKDVVGLMLYNQSEFLMALLALRKIGAVVVPLNLQLLQQDLVYVVIHAGLKRLVVADDFVPKLQPFGLELWTVSAGLQCLEDKNVASKPHEGPEDLALLIYTSGTTGNPKGVMLSEQNILHNIEGFIRRLQFGPTDTILLALPLFHAYGLTIAFTTLINGVTTALVPKFQPKQIAKMLMELPITVMPLVPTFFQILLEQLSALPEGFKHPSLRYCVSGGAALPEALLNAVEAKLGISVLEGYGLTETSPVVAVNDPAVGRVANAVGKPLENIEVKLHDVNPETGEGEVWVRGASVMQGYYKDAESTQAVLCGQEGWFKTGDLGKLDALGNLYITGRIKDLIIKAGENIAPQPIEAAIMAIKGVKEVAVIGQSHPKLGETILACVVAEGPQDANGMKQQLRQSLASFNVPDEIQFFEELPKTATGKVSKKLLKQQLQLAVPTA